jgi:hypothetical protein
MQYNMSKVNYHLPEEGKPNGTVTPAKYWCAYIFLKVKLALRLVKCQIVKYGEWR